MKKLLIVAFAMLATAMVNAQESLLPEKNSFGVEVNSTFNAAVGIRARYFATKNDAIRLGIGFNSDNEKNKGELITPMVKTDEWDAKNKKSEFTFGVGYERHFSAGKRVSPYVGAEFKFIKLSRSADGEYTTTPLGGFASTDKITASNATIDWETTMTTGVTTEDEIAKAGFGFNIFVGMDVYVWKGFYAGMELGFVGMQTLKDKDYTTELKSTGAPTTKVETDGTIRNTKGGFFAQPLLRIGYTF